MIVGIDVGYGWCKAAAMDGRRCMFPSACCQPRGTGELAVLLGGTLPRHRLTIQKLPEGGCDEWLAGDAALAAGAVRTWDISAAARADYEVLVLAALSLMGADGLVAVAAGLPLGVWLQRQERQALRDRLQGLSARVSLDGAPPRNILVSRVRVFPQGVGAYAATLHSPGGAQLAGRAVAVIDVGYRTTDYLLLTPGEGGVAVPEESRCGSVDAGAGQAVEAVRQHVAAQTGTLPPEGLVEQALRGGGLLPVRGRDIDLRPAYEAALQDLGRRVEAEVRRAWSDRLDYLAAVLVAGGGGATLAPHLRLPGVQVVPEAIFSNAVGFSILGQG